MSAQHSSAPAATSAGIDDGTAASNSTGEAGHEAAPAGEDGLALTTTAELAHLLANGQWGDSAQGQTAEAFETNGYDGHVALALDTGALPDIDTTLDLLTSSHHLFDVPALDVSSNVDDASSA